VETCPFCRADLYRHCTSKSCPWLRCKANGKSSGCGTTIDPTGHRAMHGGKPVDWPHTLPDIEPGAE
jgi:hypothetical protein